MKIVEMSNQLCIENDDKLKKMEDGIIQSQESNKMFLDDLELSGTILSQFLLTLLDIKQDARSSFDRSNKLYKL